MKSPSTDRLQAFSDGVIAVIITIMVLELKVPHESGMESLRAILPILLVYLLSFAFTGVYWINHHHLVDRIERADHLILYSNLLFLFCLSLIPFFTSYLLENKIDSFAVSLYAVSMLVTGFAFLLLRISIHRSLRRAGELRREDTAERGKHLTSLALYLTAIPLAWIYPQLALAIVGLVTVVWIVPDMAVLRKR